MGFLPPGREQQTLKIQKAVHPRQHTLAQNRSNTMSKFEFFNPDKLDLTKPFWNEGCPEDELDAALEALENLAGAFYARSVYPGIDDGEARAWAASWDADEHGGWQANTCWLAVTKASEDIWNTFERVYRNQETAKAHDEQRAKVRKEKEGAAQ
jgi:hypothetical protein